MEAISLVSVRLLSEEWISKQNWYKILEWLLGIA